MDEIDIPHYFICPISLQIMTDPVTAMTGITYDRQCIEYWLLSAEEAMCPVTKQPLPRDSDLTPNHTLRRLIQGWCVANANHGIDRIPTPRSPLAKSHVVKLLNNLKIPKLYISSLSTLDSLANENEKNRKILADSGLVEPIMASMVISCFKEGRVCGLEQILRILHLLWMQAPESKLLLPENSDFLDSLMWVLHTDMDNQVEIKTRAILVMKMVIEVMSSSALERLKNDFFEKAISFLKTRISEQAVKALLHILIKVCSWGRNRTKIIEAGGVFELLEMELGEPEKHITELSFCLLAHLCSCADGREQLLKHAGGIAIVAKRTLRISPATDDRAVHILSLIGKFSATDEVLQEMLRVGAVSKMCMVLQADCGLYLKKNVREILRLHSKVWKNSPCIPFGIITASHLAQMKISIAQTAETQSPDQNP